MDFRVQIRIWILVLLSLRSLDKVLNFLLLQSSYLWGEETILIIDLLNSTVAWRVCQECKEGWRCGLSSTKQQLQWIRGVVQVAKYLLSNMRLQVQTPEPPKKKKKSKALITLYPAHFSELCLRWATVKNEIMSPIWNKEHGSLLLAIKVIDPPSSVILSYNTNQTHHGHSVHPDLCEPTPLTPLSK
jgi:hypothetical protein